MDTKSEIFSQRLVVAVVWNIALQILLAVALVFIIQVDLLHPILWVTSTLSDIFGWKMGLNVVLLGLVSFFQAFIYGNYYMKPLPKYYTRFSMFLDMFSLQNVIFSVLYALSGYFTMGLYSSLAKGNYNILKKECEHSQGQCLMEHSLFLQFGGMWMGLYYFLNIHIFGTTTLTFPHIYQDKFQQIKIAISNILSLGFKNSVMPVMYYCICYYFWGNKPRSVVSDVYNVYLEDPPLDNLLNLLSSGIWIGLWLYTSLFFVSVYTMRTIFNIVLTEPMKFPIISDNSMTLHQALAQKSQFTGYLGAQDLRLMAMVDPSRRLEVFTLSQPGGHPRNWNNILEQCLIIINYFNKELETINGDIKPIELNNSGPRNIANISPNAGLSFTGKLRNMAESPQLYQLKDLNRNKIENTWVHSAQDEFNTFIHKLCQKPGINYLFGELADTKLKYLLLQAQPVMWTCEGLALIAAASLKEDKYGVVQNDLPILLSTLINLKQSLDKLSKPGLVPKKILSDSFAIKMKTALISSVKRSIYKIVITFSKYIHEIPLDPDVQIALQSFLLCKEA